MLRKCGNLLDVVLRVSLLAGWFIVGALLGFLGLRVAFEAALSDSFNPVYHPMRAMAAEIIGTLISFIYVCIIVVLVGALVSVRRPSERYTLKMIAKMPKDKAIAALTFLLGIPLGPLLYFVIGYIVFSFLKV